MLAVLPTASNNIGGNAATTARITTMIPISLLMGGNNESTSSNIWYSPFHGTNITTTIPTATTTATMLATTKVDNISAIIGTNVSAHITPAISHVLLAPNTTASTLAATLAANVIPTTTTTMLSQDLVSSAGMFYNTTAIAGAGSGEKINSFYTFPAHFVLLWTLFITIVLFNSAVLFVMIINKNRKSRMNYFIKQLAFADLCVGLISVSTDLLQHTTVVWRGGNIGCKLIRFSQECVSYSSTYVLVAMSIDRYDAITHPMNFSKSWKRARYLVAWAWILGATFSLPALVLYEEKEIQGVNQCWIDLGTPASWQIYFSLVAATLFAFPTIIISACYAIIIKTIWSKGSIFVPTERSGYTNAATRRASSRGIIPRAKIKTVKMTLVIVIVFIVCWLPYFTFDLLQVYQFIENTQINTAIATFMQSLSPLNSAANPIIYCIFSSQVFRTLSRFAPFKWFTCCCKSYRNNSQQNRCNTVGRRLHNSASDSMRTLTTSLTVSRRSNKTTSRVVICERPKAALPISDV